MKKFEKMQIMSDRNMDIKLAPLSNISRTEIKGQNGYVTFGVPREVAQELIDEKEFVGGFLLCNKEQFDNLLINCLENKPVIKTLKDITNIKEYLVKLKAWILENQKTYFEDPDYSASSWCDFEQWQDKRATRRELVLPNEVMLIDRTTPSGVHNYAITSITKGRKAKDHYFVVDVQEIEYGNWRNGYFLLPKL